jgi:hypothetical protein
MEIDTSIKAIDEIVGREGFGGRGLARMFFAREIDASRVFLSPEIFVGLIVVVVRTIFGSDFA